MAAPDLLNFSISCDEKLPWPWHGKRPSTEEMNVVYDWLRQVNADYLRAICGAARTAALNDGNLCHYYLAYQCCETARRWNIGQWKYHHAGE